MGEKKQGRLEGGRRGCSRVKDERGEIWRGDGRTSELWKETAFKKVRGMEEEIEREKSSGERTEMEF